MTILLPQTVSLPRSVHARLVERFIFNFRLSPEAFANLLPAPWLQPQVFNGWSVMSFCILNLDQVVLSPFPGSLGLKTISCAFRCGVVDNSGASPEPSVYITDRYTDDPIIARTAPLVFLDTIPMVNVDITQVGDTTEYHVSHLYGRPLFSAKVKPSETPSKLDSEIFDSLDAFHDFILRGVSSYAPSVKKGLLAKIDLDKEDTNYE